jgi:hypothetical protein
MAVTARPRGLSAAKLSEPVRLYLYTAAVFVIVAGAGAAALTGEWAGWAMIVAGVLVPFVIATEAARASVFCTRSALQAVLTRHLETSLTLDPSATSDAVAEMLTGRKMA